MLEKSLPSDNSAQPISEATMRTIPEAVKLETDNTFGRSNDEQQRRFLIAFRAVNGWDLDRMKAERENCVALPGLILGDLLSNLFGWFSIG
jgi:hypothetical protein